MKHFLLTTIAAVLLVGTAFADPIHDAAFDGDLAEVQAELDKGVDVNAKDENERTPLHFAAIIDHIEIAEVRKCFALYVKFPKNRWKDIERAEKNDEQGNRIYEELRAEYLEKYMPKPDADPHGGVEDFKTIEDPNQFLDNTDQITSGSKDEMNYH